MSPQRIQRRRTRGWTMPKGAIAVSRPSEFANPFRITVGTEAKTGKRIHMVEGTNNVWICDSKEHAHEVATALFDLWAQHPAQRTWRNRARLMLRGHDLACWCGLDVDCHGDPLLLIVSQPLE